MFDYKLSKRIAIMLMSSAFITSCAQLKTPTKPKATTSSLNVTKYVLDNGLTVLIAPNPKLPIASYYTLFDVGGRYETKGTTGATHFLEHMMFKGAKKYGPGEFDTLIEKNGGMTNAYTTNDSTVYYQNIPANFVEKMIDLEADRLQHLLLENESFESERKVVFEERKMRYENNPDGFLYLMMMKKVFEGTPYGQSVIGDVEDLEALTRDQVMEFFRTYYTPNNAIVSIAGDVEPSKILPLIKEKYGSIKSSSSIREIKSKKDDQGNFKSKAKFGVEYDYYATNPTPKIMLAFLGEKLGTRKAFVMDVLAYMLGNGGSSYLAQKYVKNNKPMMSDISMNNYNLVHSGVFYIGGELLEKIPVQVAKNQLKKDIKRFCNEGLDARTLQKTKNQIMAQAYNQMKSNAGMASMIMLNEKLYGDYNFGIKEMEIYNSVTESEVKKTCEEVLINQEPIILSAWNKFPKNGVVR